MRHMTKNSVEELFRDIENYHHTHDVVHVFDIGSDGCSDASGCRPVESQSAVASLPVGIGVADETGSGSLRSAFQRICPLLTLAWRCVSRLRATEQRGAQERLCASQQVAAIIWLFGFRNGRLSASIGLGTMTSGYLNKSFAGCSGFYSKRPVALPGCHQNT